MVSIKTEDTYLDNIIAWKGFPNYALFVTGIPQTALGSPHLGPVMRTFGDFFVVSLASCWIESPVASELGRLDALMTSNFAYEIVTLYPV